MSPQTGDVLVCRRVAEKEHEISIVPKAPHMVGASHDWAVARGRELAERLRVDAWLSEDHIHFLKLASHREHASHARGG